MYKKKIWTSVFLGAFVIAGLIGLRITRDVIIVSLGIRVLHLIEVTLVFATSYSVIYSMINLFLWVRAKISAAASSRKEAESKIVAEKRLMAMLKTDPSKRLSLAISSLLEEKPTTPFFEDSLKELGQHVMLISTRVDNVLDMAAEEFGVDTLSYSQFAQPVQHLYQHLIDSGMDVVQQLNMFDALRYADMISNARSAKASKEYEKVMRRYNDLVVSTLSVFEQAVLKLDTLQVEISSMGFDNVKEAVETLSQLETVMQSTIP